MTFDISLEDILIEYFYDLTGWPIGTNEVNNKSKVKKL